MLNPCLSDRPPETQLRLLRLLCIADSNVPGADF